MSAVITNPELHAFQRRVLGKINELQASTYWYGYDEVKRELGLDDLADDQRVIVRVTVPAIDEATARERVADQLDGLFLPSGWSAEVVGLFLSTDVPAEVVA